MQQYCLTALVSICGNSHREGKGKKKRVAAQNAKKVVQTEFFGYQHRMQRKLYQLNIFSFNSFCDKKI